MTVESWPCAECEESVPLDVDHVKVNADLFRMEDRNGEESFIFCNDCWEDVSEGWFEA